MPIESAPPFYVLSCARLRLVARILFDPASLTGREGDPQFLDLPRRHSAQLGFFPIAPDDQLEIGSGVGDVMFIETPEQYGQLIWCEGISLHDVRNERLDIELLVDVGEFDKRVDEFSFLRFVDEVAAIPVDAATGFFAIEDVAERVGCRNTEPVDALRAHQHFVAVVPVDDLEVVADVRVFAELTGTGGSFHVVHVAGIHPFVERDGKLALLDTQRQKIGCTSLGPAHCTLRPE